MKSKNDYFCPNCEYSGSDVICPLCGSQTLVLDVDEKALIGEEAYPEEVADELKDENPGVETLKDDDLTPAGNF